MHIASQFVNYRLSPDVVSDLPLKKYYGNTFVFPCAQGWMASHKMGTMMTTLPEDILSQTVGTSDSSKKHNLLVELTNGVMQSYQCRVEGQFFSRFRSGAQNLAKMQKELPSVLESIKAGDYDAAIVKLDEIQRTLSGSVSVGIINVLIQSTLNIKISEQIRLAQIERGSDKVGEAAVRIVEERTNPVITEEVEELVVSQPEEEHPESVHSPEIEKQLSMRSRLSAFRDKDLQVEVEETLAEDTEIRNGM